MNHAERINPQGTILDIVSGPPPETLESIKAACRLYNVPFKESDTFSFASQPSGDSHVPSVQLVTSIALSQVRYGVGNTSLAIVIEPPNLASSTSAFPSDGAAPPATPTSPTAAPPLPYPPPLWLSHLGGSSLSSADAATSATSDLSMPALPAPATDATFKAAPPFSAAAAAAMPSFSAASSSSAAAPETAGRHEFPGAGTSSSSGAAAMPAMHQFAAAGPGSPFSAAASISSAFGTRAAETPLFPAHFPRWAAPAVAETHPKEVAAAAAATQPLHSAAAAATRPSYSAGVAATQPSRSAGLAATQPSHSAAVAATWPSYSAAAAATRPDSPRVVGTRSGSTSAPATATDAFVAAAGAASSSSVAVVASSSSVPAQLAIMLESSDSDLDIDTSLPLPSLPLPLAHLVDKFTLPPTIEGLIGDLFSSGFRLAESGNDDGVGIPPPSARVMGLFRSILLDQIRNPAVSKAIEARHPRPNFHSHRPEILNLVMTKPLDSLIDSVGRGFIVQFTDGEEFMAVDAGGPRKTFFSYFWDDFRTTGLRNGVPEIPSRPFHIPGVAHRPGTLSQRCISLVAIGRLAALMAASDLPGPHCLPRPLAHQLVYGAFSPQQLAHELAVHGASDPTIHPTVRQLFIAQDSLELAPALTAYHRAQDPHHDPVLAQDLDLRELRGELESFIVELVFPGAFEAIASMRQGFLGTGIVDYFAGKRALDELVDFWCPAMPSRVAEELSRRVVTSTATVLAMEFKDVIRTWIVSMGQDDNESALFPFLFACYGHCDPHLAIHQHTLDVRVQRAGLHHDGADMQTRYSTCGLSITFHVSGPVFDVLEQGFESPEIEQEEAARSRVRALWELEMVDAAQLHGVGGGIYTTGA
ncbi:hypothetical protein BCR44DRAFT_62762 [Catenaria anguillulae PL171]|uniref:Uncharacterized protein n=1 Tax=Catenaria anguillulae PL171 TaxID=765915 RepID=A0A1Y2I134_9FUNG|nr:hypothetical protein BCR44DRAFT_62762 [Catenaria anguillulae PL171]